jgi:hypothetical protein
VRDRAANPRLAFGFAVRNAIGVAIPLVAGVIAVSLLEPGDLLLGLICAVWMAPLIARG